MPLDVGTAQECTRLLVATALAGVIGLERELDAQAAGFRTHVLVGLGAGLFTVVGTGLDGSDPTRIAAQVVTGVGFLGAGAILHSGVTVRGLTTAASLWVAAAAGVACGLGSLVTATAGTLLALAALVGLKLLERDVFPRQRGHEVVLELEGTADLQAVRERACAVLGAPVTARSVSPCDHDGMLLRLSSPLARGYEVLDLVTRLRALDGVVGVQLGV